VQKDTICQFTLIYVTLLVRTQRVGDKEES